MNIISQLFCILILLFSGSSLAQSPLPIGASEPAPTTYLDVPANHWAFTALDQMTHLGIFTGYPDGLFRGDEKLSRYEAAIVAARLIDYVDAILLILANDPEIAEKLKEAARDLDPVSTLSERTNILEQQMQDAASLDYTRALEDRIIVLEQTLNDLLGTDLPATPLSDTRPDMSQSAADSIETSSNISGNTSSSQPPEDRFSLIPTPLPDIAIKAGANYPIYVGFSPGIISSSGDVYFATQLGYDGLWGPLGAVSRLVFNTGLRELRASVDSTVRLQAFSETLELYGGMGLGVSVQPVGNALLLEVPFGFEYFISPQIGLFGQIITAYSFAPINNVDAHITMGLNLRF